MSPVSWGWSGRRCGCWPRTLPNPWRPRAGRSPRSSRTPASISIWRRWLRAPSPTAFLETLYRPGETGRIPIVAVTGTNGKTTVTRLVAHGLAVSGRFVGMTCTDGIYLADRRIDTDDCSGPKSARLVLLNPQVEAAVLETARGGILREGLGFDACDVAVVTNIGEGDHLGLELDRHRRGTGRGQTDGGARRRSLGDRGAQRRRSAGGRHGGALQGPGAVSSPATAPIRCSSQHRGQGGRVAFVRGTGAGPGRGRGRAVRAVARSHPPDPRRPHRLPGRERAWPAPPPCGRSTSRPEALCAALETFGADLDKSPGRFNVLAINGATVVFDYGHNPSALLAMIEALERLPPPAAHRRLFRGRRSARRRPDPPGRDSWATPSTGSSSTRTTTPADACRGRSCRCSAGDWPLGDRVAGGPDHPRLAARGRGGAVARPAGGPAAGAGGRDRRDRRLCPRPPGRGRRRVGNCR